MTERTCDGLTGLGPCDKTAKYALMPLYAMIGNKSARRKEGQVPTKKVACGIHLQQLTTSMLRNEGPVVVSD